MITISPQLTNKELNLLREYIDQRGGVNLAAKKIGIHRNTVRLAVVSGVVSEDTAKKIRSFLKSLK